jgi:hypothetical protein
MNDILRGKKVVIFGAGGSGHATYNHYKSLCSIICFVDNNKELQGNRLEDLPVHDPSKLLELDFDIVLIGSSWWKEISSQLIEKFRIDPKAIFHAPEKVINYERPFNDESQAMWLASQVSTFFQKNNCPIFLEGGVLLGLLRNGKPLPWDHDIDFVFPAERITEVKSITLMLVHYFRNQGIQCSAFQSVMLRDPSKVWRIHLMLSSNLSEKISIDLSPAYMDGERIFAAGYRFPDRLMQSVTHLESTGLCFTTFTPPEEYLSAIYGEWRIENKDFNYWEEHDAVFELDYLEFELR